MTLAMKPASQKYLVRTLQIVLTLTIGSQLASLTWQLIPEAEQNDAYTPSSSTRNSANNANNKRNQLAGVSEFYLFGRQATQKTSEATKTNIPVSRLALKLMGLVSSTEAKNELAIISSKGKVKIYQVGEKITGSQAVLEDISPDRVLIRNGNKIESILMFPDEAEKKAAVLQPPASRQSSAKVNRARITAKSLPDLVKISPMTANGKLQGYTIRPGKDRETFEQLGLKDHDLVVGIDNYDLTNQLDAMQIAKELSKMKNFTLKIKRGNQEVYVPVDL